MLEKWWELQSIHPIVVGVLFVNGDHSRWDGERAGGGVVVHTKNVRLYCKIVMKQKRTIAIGGLPHKEKEAPAYGIDEVARASTSTCPSSVSIF